MSKDMAPWSEILECNNLDIWILVLDLKIGLLSEKYLPREKCHTWGRFQKTKSLAPEWWSCLLSSEASLKFTVMIFTRFWGVKFSISNQLQFFYLKYKATVVEVLCRSPDWRNTFHEWHPGKPKSSLSEIILQWNGIRKEDRDIYSSRLCYVLYTCTVQGQGV